MDNNFSASIRSWYTLYKRDLPWRSTKDPYLIWISEIILQQTRVEQGLPYYLRFTSEFPTVCLLASAELGQVLLMWQGLGYYTRARNMHATAKQICEKFNGIFPSNFTALKTLKGIGEYSAAAIASFAFNEPVPVVDGNVYRLLARYTGTYAVVGTPAAKREFTQLAAKLLPAGYPAWHNQAIMEFGSRVCTPRKPLCESCALNPSCYAYGQKAQYSLPVKAASKTSRRRYFNYLLPAAGETYFLKKRREKDIWEGLYDFPGFETREALTVEEFSTHPQLKALGLDEITYHAVSHSRHILSHQIIHASFWRIGIAMHQKPGGLETLSIAREELKNYALPRIITRYLEGLEC